MADNPSCNEPSSNSLKEKIEKLERKLLSCQIENSNKASEIKKYRDELAKYHSSTNNTSSQFPLTSTFTQQWDNFALGTIMDTFEKVYNSSELVAYLVKAVFIEVRSACKRLINEKIKELIGYLGIKERITDDIISFVYMKYKVIIFQDYFSTLFQLNDKAVNSIIGKAQEQIDLIHKAKTNGMRNGIHDIIKERYADIVYDIHSNEMRKCIKEAFDLNMFLLLHEPELFVEFNEELSYLLFDKNEHINIEGFAGNNSPCILILPPPTFRKGLRFQGIKAAVYICLAPLECRMKECAAHNSQRHINQKVCKSLVNSLGSFDISINNKESPVNHCIDESNNSSMMKERSLMNERKQRVKNHQQGYSNKLSFERAIPRSKKKGILYKTKSASIKKTKNSIKHMNGDNNNCTLKPSLSSTFTLIKAFDESKNNNSSASLSKKKSRCSFNKDEFLRSISGKILQRNIILKKASSNPQEKLQYETKSKKTEKSSTNTVDNKVYSPMQEQLAENSKVNCQFRTQLPCTNSKKAFFEESNSRNDYHQMMNQFRYNTNLLHTNISSKKKKIMQNREPSNKSLVKKLESNESSFRRLLMNLNHHIGAGVTMNSKKKALVSYSSRRIDCNNSQRKVKQERNERVKHVSPPLSSIELIAKLQSSDKLEEKRASKHANDILLLNNGSNTNVRVLSQGRKTHEPGASCFNNNKNDMQFNGLRKL